MPGEGIGDGTIPPALGRQLPQAYQRREVDRIGAQRHPRRTPGGGGAVRGFGVLGWQIAKWHRAVVVPIAGPILFAIDRTAIEMPPIHTITKPHYPQQSPPAP